MKKLVFGYTGGRIGRHLLASTIFLGDAMRYFPDTAYAVNCRQELENRLSMAAHKMKHAKVFHQAFLNLHRHALLAGNRVGCVKTLEHARTARQRYAVAAELWNVCNAALGVSDENA